ncbi:unnamed protein product [Pieris macdunnoughi]|uniref:Uncharacterized protein n=1 Tax=Pieris macdunnoughi TaxID=345717 RepID=A0A821WEM1_9NEOP|nr:unnamed protein product [Pieris macdunnoughi]
MVRNRGDRRGRRGAPCRRRWLGRARTQPWTHSPSDHCIHSRPHPINTRGRNFHAAPTSVQRAVRENLFFGTYDACVRLAPSRQIWIAAVRVAGSPRQVLATLTRHTS